MKLIKYILILGVFICSNTYAVDRYIDCDGANGDGSSGSPYNNFASAIADLTDNAANNIYVKGTCAEAVTINKSGADSSNHIVIQTWDGNCVMDGTGLANEDGFEITGDEDFITIKAISPQTLTIQDYEESGVRCQASSGSESQYIYVDGGSGSGLIFSGNNTDSGFDGAVNFDYVDFGKVENIKITSTTYVGVRGRNCDGSAGTKWIVNNVNQDGLTDRGGTNYSIFFRDSSHINVTGADIDIAMVTTQDKRGIFFQGCNNILVDDCSAISSTVGVSGNNSVGIQMQSVHTSTVSDCIVENWGEDGYEVDLDGDPAVNGYSYDVVIERSLCKNCTNGNFEMADAIGHDGATDKPVIIKNCISIITSTSVASGAPAFGFHGGSGGANDGSIEWYYNTAYVTATGRHGFWIGKSNGTNGLNDLKLKNNISYTADQHGLRFQGDNITVAIDDGDVQYNSWFRADDGDIIRWLNVADGDNTYDNELVEDGTVYTNHTIEQAAFHVDGAPSFVNAPTDLSLNSGDARIDAGLTITGITNDYNQITRPQGSASDIGAHELRAGGISIQSGFVYDSGFLFN